MEDLAEGNVLALKPGARNSTYNLDGREKVTIRELAETIQRIVGEVAIDYTPTRPGDFSGKDVSSEKARKELGWEPNTTLDEGVDRYIEWVKQQERRHEDRWASVDGRLRA